jgi:hypothetical protein
VSDLTFYDAAYPPASPPETDGVCIYIGGDTPHVWTDAEIAAQKARYRLPIYVRSDPSSSNPLTDVEEAVGQLHAIGAPNGCLVAWDLETAVDSAYIHQVYDHLKSAGYTLIVYGSQSVVLGNDSPNGLYFGADWTGTPHIASGDVMTQYVSYSAYDLSLAQSTLPFWDTSAPQEEEEMAYVFTDLASGPAVCLPVPAGKTKCLIYADPGYNGLVAPQIRVGTGPNWNGGPTVSPEWDRPATVNLTPGCTMVTIARRDTGATPFTVDFA